MKSAAKTSRFFSFGLALLVCLATALVAPANAEVIYIRNQRLSVDQVEGARVVQLDAFRAVLAVEELARLKSVGDTLSVVNLAGQSQSYKLTPYGELVEWEDALQWLGYQRRDNPQTGVVDWVNGSAGTSVSAVKVWKQPTAEELAARRVVSMRRTGYRSAEKSFHAIITKLGQGGTDADRERITRLGYQIVDQSPLAELAWTFEVAATPVPNALCTGEGFVVVTEGLLALDLTDDELAGVLGHEVAHGVRRHALLYEEHYTEARRLSQELHQLESDAATADEEHDQHRMQTIRSRVNAMVPRLEFLADFVKNQQSYNQHEEEEADVAGMHYAVGAGFDPDGEGRALLKLRNRSVELFGQAYQEGSRTHPPLKRRLEIQSLVQKRWDSERSK